MLNLFERCLNSCSHWQNLSLNYCFQYSEPLNFYKKKKMSSNIDDLSQTSDLPDLAEKIVEVIDSFDKNAFETIYFNPENPLIGFLTINYILLSTPFIHTVYFCPCIDQFKKEIFAFNQLPLESDILIFTILDSNGFYQILAFGYINTASYDKFFQILAEKAPIIQNFFVPNFKCVPPLLTHFPKAHILLLEYVLCNACGEKWNEFLPFFQDKTSEYIPDDDHPIFTILSTPNIIWKPQHIEYEGFAKFYYERKLDSHFPLFMLYFQQNLKSKTRISLDNLLTFIIAQAGSLLSQSYDFVSQSRLKEEQDILKYAKQLHDNHIISLITIKNLGYQTLKELYYNMLLCNNPPPQNNCYECQINDKNKTIPCVHVILEKIQNQYCSQPFLFVLDDFPQQFKQFQFPKDFSINFPICKILLSKDMMIKIFNNNKKSLLKNEEFIIFFQQMKEWSSSHSQGHPKIKPANMVDGKHSKKNKYYTKIFNLIVTDVIFQGIDFNSIKKD